MAGSSNSPISGDKSENSRGYDDFWIVKIDENGSKIWDKRYGGNAKDISYKAIQLNDNGFLLVGESRSSVGG